MFILTLQRFLVIVKENYALIVKGLLSNDFTQTYTITSQQVIQDTF